MGVYGALKVGLVMASTPILVLQNRSLTTGYSLASSQDTATRVQILDKADCIFT